MLKQRIEKLEMYSADREDVLVIINCYFGPSGWIEPAIGYYIGSEKLFKLEIESNLELEDRACAALRAQAPNDANVLVLEPIGHEETFSLL